VNYLSSEVHLGLNGESPDQFTQHGGSFQCKTTACIIGLVNHKIEETADFWDPVDPVVNQDVVILIVPLRKYTGV